MQVIRKNDALKDDGNAYTAHCVIVLLSSEIKM